jgi:hypothetical protein
LIDGKGVFLPESKRGFPSVSAAFFKICGLSNLFKKSTFFNKYHLGFLPEMQTNEVDVLVGCFMMLPKKVLDQTRGFSEDYFMYGEDIDLSYCVQKAGYKNIYFPETTVIHYKGESTKKGTLNYVKLFYNAMIIFAQKHLNKNSKRVFIPLIKLAIAARAMLSIANRFLSTLWLPIIDCAFMFISLVQTKKYWLQYIKPDTIYNAVQVSTFFTIYILTWLICLFFYGAYDKPIKKYKIIFGMCIGAILTTSIYGLLPENIRFSRGITVIGALLSALLIWLFRFILQKLGVLDNTDSKNKSILTVSNTNQINSIKKLLKDAGIDKDIVGNVYDSQQNKSDLGSAENLKQIAELYKIGEIIFAYPSNSFKDIIHNISNLGSQFNYKIHGLHTESIIGSNSKNTAGDLYASDWHFNIATSEGRRNKRVFDVLSALIILISMPINYWFIKQKNIYANAIWVLLGKKTWFTYHHSNANLPKLKPGVFSICKDATGINVQQLDLLYARNYKAAEDRKMLLQYLFD